MRTAEKPVAVSASTAVHEQTGGTCYAHAVATVMRAAEKRVVGRELHKHEEIVSPIINKFGMNGADVERFFSTNVPSDACAFARWIATRL